MFVGLCKGFVGVFLFYQMWFSQVFGADQRILYLSVGLSAVCMLVDMILVERRIAIGKINLMVKVYVVFGVYALLTGIVVATDRSALMSTMFTYIAYTMVAFELWYISYRSDNFKWLLDYVYLLALLCAATTIFWGQDYRTEVIVTTMSSYNNPNTLGVLMVFGVFSAVFQKDRFVEQFTVRFISVLAFLYTIILSGSRKALFAGAALFLLWIIVYFADRKGKKSTFKSVYIATAIAGSLVAAVIYILNVYIGTSGFERLLLFFSEEGISVRMAMMVYAVELWKGMPVFGIGLGQFAILSPFGTYSHSTYTEILSCTGLLGCLIFFVPLIKLLISAIKKVFTTTNSDYKNRLCLLLLMLEFFLGIGQIFVYSFTHMLILVIIANIVSDDIQTDFNKKRIKLYVM